MMVDEKPIRVAITGGTGHMGRELIALTETFQGIELGAVFVRKNSPLIGTDIGELIGLPINSVAISDDLSSQKDKFEVLIDFTSPEGTRNYLEFCQKHNKPMVVGTTGMLDSDKEKISWVSSQIPIVSAPNFSIGINLLLTLLEKTAKIMGAKTAIEIVETHHKHKIDSPSGTALAMGEIIANTLRKELKHCAIYGSETKIEERAQGSIAFTSIRSGDIIGEHTAFFVDDTERLEISHKASTRKAFATGALKAAVWIATKPAGLYTMQNVLEFE